MKTKIDSSLSDKHRHLENKFLAGNDFMIDIFTSEDMEDVSLFIFRYLLHTSPYFQ